MCKSRLKQYSLISWKILSLDMRKNRKTELFRQISTKNKIFGAFLKI